MSDEGMKYTYVKRRLYDNYVDRTAKRFDRIIHQQAVQEGWISDVALALEDRLSSLEAEVESLRLDKTSVRIAGRRDTTRHND